MTDGDVERYNKMISKRLLASFVEEVGADTVVVVYSKSDGEHTSVQMGRFGNVLTCVGLIDWIQDKFTEGYENMRDEQDPEDIA